MLKYYNNTQNFRLEFVSGGEPLLNKKLLKEIFDLNQRDFYEKNLTTRLLTNATFLDNDFIEVLNQNHILLAISLDGDKYNHDRQRIMKNKNSNYEIILRWNQFLKSNNKLNANIQNFWVVTIITAETTSLIDILKHHYSLGIKRIEMKFARGIGDEKVFLSDTNLYRFKALYKDLYTFFKMNIASKNYEYLKMILNDYDYFGKIIKRLLSRSSYNYRCGAAKSKLAFTADGYIYPCDSFANIPQFKLGDLNNEQINTLIINDFCQMSSELQIPCNDCEFRYLCCGDCLYNAYVQNNSIKIHKTAGCKLMHYICCLSVDLVFWLRNIDYDGYTYLKRFSELNFKGVY